MNLKDICLLKYGYIHEQYIHFRRAKTKFTNRNSKPTSVETTAAYLDSFEDEKKKEMAGKLTAFENLQK